MEELLKSLNAEQKEAVVEKEGALLVLAGAGSGKTKVLTTRIVNLVKSGVNPYKILAVTFTNKAAKEMRERLSKMIGEDVVKKMWVGTFHNICGRILRFDIENYKSPDGRKWDNNYVIYDESDTNTLIKNAIKKLNLDEKVYAPKLVKAAISNAKSKMQDAYTFSTRARDYRTQKISEVYEEYEKQLLANNAIDFDDMLLLTVNLLSTNEEVRNKYHERFSHILVDEFQDTNISQYMLIRHLYSNNKTDEELKGRSLCVVGDVDQSIYSWRGADYKIILNFQTDYRNAKLIKLEKNYRSVATILDAANAIIVNNTEHVSKNLYSTKGQGEKIDIYEAQDEAGEAYYIANKIRNYARNLNDYAVLYRTNSQSRAIEEALISQGISYRMVGGLKFYDRKEIKDLIAYLKLIYNRHDSQSLKRIINVPKRSIGDTTVKKLQEIADRLEEMRKKSVLNGFMKVFQVIGMVVGAIASVASIAAGALTGNPLLIAAGVVGMTMTVDSALSMASDGKYSIAAGFTELGKKMGMSDEAAQWFGFGMNMGIMLVSIGVSFGAGFGSSASSAAQLSSEAVKKAVDVTSMAAKISNIASGILTTATGAGTIAGAVFDYNIASSQADSKLLEAILERLRESIEMDRAMVEAEMERASELMSQVRDIVGDCVDTQAAILTGAPSMA